MIQVSQLSKRFGDTWAVERLDFSVADGEILGFLGPNGAGKTTTMRLLTGFFPPTSGTVRVAGFDVTDDPLPARRAVGYLPESVALYPDMRIAEYLWFVAGAKGLAKPRARREVARVMELTGLTERKGQLIKQLSKGFRQRTGLAQALLGDPPVLILDEPTIGLDPGQIVGIRSLIKGFAGIKTVILSTHILPEVSAVCSRVAIINQGRLVAEGPPDILRSSQDGGANLRLVCQGGPEEIGRVLDQVPGVQSVQPQAQPAGPEGSCTLTLEIKGDLRVQAAVAKAIVESGLGLLELAPTGDSLEEVFLKLTSEDKPSGEGKSA